MNRIVMFSGGIGSWATAKRVAQEHGTDGLELWFADTKYEDEDLYRFLDEAAANVGAPLVKLADGRNIWEVFKDERFLGNSRIDPCSKILKRQLLRAELESRFTPGNVIVYLGIDFYEMHRFEKAAKYWVPWTAKAPLCEPPYIDKPDMIAWSEREGVKAPRLYEMGFAHNNCGGGCIKAGMSQFKLLLEKIPERYAEWEREEQGMRDQLGNVAILTDRSGPCTTCGLERKTHITDEHGHLIGPDGHKFFNRRPLTLHDFRVRVQGGDACDTVEDGSGCACFTPDEYEGGA